MVLTVVAVVLALIVVVVTRTVWRDTHRTGLSEAVDAVPRSTLRLGFTDWTAVRKELGVPDQSNPSAGTVVRGNSPWYARLWIVNTTAAAATFGQR